MNIFSSTPVSVFRFPFLRKFIRDASEQKRMEALTVELRAAKARVNALQDLNVEILQNQEMLALEFEHRLVNGLQSVTALLSLQSRNATPEAAKQLGIAARRVAAFGRVHRRLHLLDHKRTVEFKQYLRYLCDDLSDLLFRDGENGHFIVVDGARCEIPTATAIPLGFIVNELVTNAVKYAQSNITVRIETAPDSYSLSVLDDGRGLPSGFDPARSRGLGMKIVSSLVKQIGAALEIGTNDNGRGACFTVAFRSPDFDALAGCRL